MKVEIGLEPWTEAATNEQVMSGRPDIRVMGVPPWLRWIRNTMHNDRYFLYHHMGQDSFVLALWLWSPDEPGPDIAAELLVLDHPPTRVWPFDMSPEMMLIYLHGKGKTIADSIAEAKAARRQYYDDNKQHQRDLATHFRRRGNESLAQSIQHNPIMAPHHIEGASEKAHELYRAATKI